MILHELLTRPLILLQVIEREEISASEREGWVHINWRISEGSSKRDMEIREK